MIATDVGNCKALLFGEEGDELGDAGILTHIMNTQEIAEAMITLAKSETLREQMGEVGYARVNAYYQIEQMREKYNDIYKDVLGKEGEWKWLE